MAGPLAAPQHLSGTDDGAEYDIEPVRRPTAEIYSPQIPNIFRRCVALCRPQCHSSGMNDLQLEVSVLCRERPHPALPTTFPRLHHTQGGWPSEQWEAGALQLDLQALVEFGLELNKKLRVIS